VVLLKWMRTMKIKVKKIVRVTMKRISLPIQSRKMLRLRNSITKIRT